MNSITNPDWSVEACSGHFTIMGSIPVQCLYCVTVWPGLCTLLTCFCLPQVSQSWTPDCWPQFVMLIIVTCRDKECTDCVHSRLMSSKLLPSAGLIVAPPVLPSGSGDLPPPGVTKSRSRRWILQTAAPASPPGGKIIDLNSVPFLPSSGYFLRHVFWKTKNFHNKIWS